ncbi:hypothetical protein NIES4106_61220 (plasmid) [Fischerella sp. NIES-4106]|nr:hypothetical protein NIES4106_61220 [Fischerella sp. NIES-4106]
MGKQSLKTITSCYETGRKSAAKFRQSRTGFTEKVFVLALTTKLYFLITVAVLPYFIVSTIKAISE